MVTQTIGPGRPSPLGPYGPGKPGWPRSPWFYKRERQNNIRQITVEMQDYYMFQNSIVHMEFLVL